MSLAEDGVCDICGEPVVGYAHGTRPCMVTPAGVVFAIGPLTHEHHDSQGGKAFNGLVPEHGVRPPVP